MVRYKVPFYSNTSDNTHCFQASIKSVLKYFSPEKEFTFAELDKISGKEPDLWTWPQSAKINLIKMGFEIKEIENWDIDEFINTGEKYLIKRYGKEVAGEQVSHSNIKLARSDYKKYKTYKVLEKRIPKIVDIEKFLDARYLVCCNLNSKALNNLKGYSGHFVVIIGYERGYIYMHDPGLPPHENRKVSFNQFLKAWAYPDEASQNITAFKLTR